MRIDNFRPVSTAWHLSHSHIYPIWIWKQTKQPTNRRKKNQRTHILLKTHRAKDKSK